MSCIYMCIYKGALIEMYNSIHIIQRLSYLPLAGRVNLSNPDHEFHLLEDYGDNPNETPLEPKRVFLGRLIAEGQRFLIQKYAVKNRYFIGNTSMDAQLSLIMANMARVKCDVSNVYIFCLFLSCICAYTVYMCVYKLNVSKSVSTLCMVGPATCNQSCSVYCIVGIIHSQLARLRVEMSNVGCLSM